jgi:hypothetical protein
MRVRERDESDDEDDEIDESRIACLLLMEGDFGETSRRGDETRRDETDETRQ